jgi:hypothetical protein
VKYLLSCLLLLALSLPATLCGQPTVGLLQAHPGSYGGYTLIAPSGVREIYLIDPCGREVHRWTSDYGPGLSTYLLEDGRLLRSSRLPGLPPPAGGGGVEIRDWDNNLLWSYVFNGPTYRQHHDIRMLPNGNVLLLAHETLDYATCLGLGRDSSLLNVNGLLFEFIVEVQPIGADSGVVVWEWHMKDHVVQDRDPGLPGYGVISEHPELLNINSSDNNSSDWLHGNTVSYNAELDQVILNTRNQHEFYVIDHSTTTAEAAGHTGGVHGRGGDFLYRWGNPANYGRGTVADQQLWLQHDVHWIDDGLPGAGQILLFNNGLGRPSGNYSTVITLETPVNAAGDYPISPSAAWGPTAPSWTYQAPVPTDFYSHNISGAQRLPNGNTHICEGAKGRIFEVDSVGNMVWEYVVPLANGFPITQGDSAANNTTFRSYRYGVDYPAFVGHDLTPGAPLELSPLPFSAECLALQLELAQEALIEIAPNPFESELRLTAPLGSEWSLMSLNGSILQRGITTSVREQFNWGELPQGLYLLRVNHAIGVRTLLLHHL